MKLINININQYFHMIPLWKSPIKLPVELPVGATRGASHPRKGLRYIRIMCEIGWGVWVGERPIRPWKLNSF